MGKSKKNKKKKAGGKSHINGEKDNNTKGHDQNAVEAPHDASELEMKIQAQDLPNGPEPDEATDPDATDCEATEPDGMGPQIATKLQSPVPLESDPRFEALVRDRDSLRVEVVEMRRTLEQIQSKHDEEMEALQNKLQETQNEKHNAETQFRNLLGKEELSLARSRIEELEGQNETLKSEVETKSAQVESLEEEGEQRSKEISGLRNRTNLSQQNWLKEREELLEQEAYLRAEFEDAKQAMHNWEILAMEERSVREGLADRVVDLEEQLNSLKIDYEKASNESRSQDITVEGLQKALQEIQTARKQELRELVETSDAQAEDLRRKLQYAEKSAADANAELEQTKKELERASPFEKEVKEKNLLIGKLRHEAVTLNEHLTKALRFLKKGRPEDNVDRFVTTREVIYRMGFNDGYRNLVTNHFLHFLALDRSDPKKFQVLQLIAALLGWTDGWIDPLFNALSLKTDICTLEQREQAGLARPGSTASLSLRVPGASPVHRTPSSPALTTDYFSETTPSRKESLAELWSNFLEQESQTGKRHKESHEHA
ncbi:conserved hypothetical protein [Uncinocarpus reesii 1704]|uniref:GRIP-related Arf-binding domain-containing protein n=1 Tax=Uncinocarpus reesii (strain UAMH 1704) TaxID=336963 RepID=C4JTB9_UNCRE|nr:uncharacterized protein UREG_05708 [Uncinocarpus reesii 1704]EEP80866.1 conserved hypothetical protein [Uncinocarpus reesii 1704]